MSDITKIVLIICGTVLLALLISQAPDIIEQNSKPSFYSRGLR